MPGENTTSESADQEHTEAGGSTQVAEAEAGDDQKAAEQPDAQTAAVAETDATKTPAEAESQGAGETEQAKGDEPKAETDEPKSLELSIPEGGHIAEQDVENIRELAGKRGWNQEQAQAALDFWSEERAGIAAMHAEWRELSEKDPEIGGDKLKESAEHARRALDRFGSDELKQVMEEARLGDHPAFVRFFLKLGKAMAEDVVVTSGGAAARPKKTFADLYT